MGGGERRTSINSDFSLKPSLILTFPLAILFGMGRKGDDNNEVGREGGMEHANKVRCRG